MKKITLIQTVSTFKGYQQMLALNQLPLVLKVTEDELEEIKKEKQENGLNIHSLYYNTYCPLQYEINLFISAEQLKRLIESKKIYIPTFVDQEGKIKFVDYIYKSYSNKIKSGIVFRDKKRLFEKSQAGYSLKKNRMKLIPTEFKLEEQVQVSHSIYTTLPPQNFIELYSLCLDTIWEQDELNEQQLIKTI